MKNPMLWLRLRRLKTGNDWKRYRAAKKLGKSRNKRAIEPLLAALIDHYDQVRRVAAEALDKIDPDWRKSEAAYNKVSFFLNILLDKGLWWRHAAEALGEIRDIRAIEPLIATLGDCKDNWDGNTVLWALEKIDPNWVKTEVAHNTVPAFSALLKQNPSLAANILVAIGGAKAIDSLLFALADDNNNVREAARSALIKIGEPSTIDLLWDALITKRFQLKDVEILVKLDPSWAKSEIAHRAVPLFIAALTDKNELVRSTAAKALGKIGDKRAIVPLLTALIDNNWSVRYDANRALEKIDPEWANSEIAHKAIPMFALAIVEAEMYGDIGEEAVKILNKIDTKYEKSEDIKLVIPSLVDVVLKHDSDRRRYTAVKILRQIDDARVIELLVTALKDQDASIRRRAAEVLPELGDAQVVEPLIIALKDQDSGVRSEAVKALRQLRDTRAVGPLIIALQDQDSSVRQVTVEALRQLGDTRAVESLIIALKDQDDRVRREAVMTLGQLKDARAVKPLVALLKDKATYMRHEAAKALDSLGWQPANDIQGALYAVAFKNWDKAVSYGTVAVDALLIALKEEYNKKVQEALKEIGNASIEPLVNELKKIYIHDWRNRQISETLALFGEACIPALVRELSHKDSNVRSNATYTLGLMGTTALEALPNLIKCLSDEELRVRRSAATAIGDLGTEAKEAVPHLIEVWCVPNEFDYSSLDVIDKMKIEDPRIINPLLQYLFSSPHDNNSDIFGKATIVLSTLLPYSALTDQIVRWIIEAAGFHYSQSYKYAHDINTKASDAAIQQLCALKSPVTNNVLHLITQKRDVSVKISPGCGGGGSWEEKISFQNQRTTAQEELKKRGEPQYQPEAYLKLSTLKRLNPYLREPFNIKFI